MNDARIHSFSQTDTGLRSGPGPLAQLGAVFRPRELAAVGMTPDQLPALVRQGLVERVGRGLYRVADEPPTENYTLAMASARVTDGIVCLLTALRVHGLGTQAPSAVWMAIPQRSRTPRVRDIRIRFVRFSGPAATYGVVATAFEGVPARITNPARTIVDCFRLVRLVGPEPGVEALHDALARRVVTVDELARVESVLPCRKLRAHLEVARI